MELTNCKNFCTLFFYFLYDNIDNFLFELIKRYDLMKKCWLYKTDERPSFEEIKGFFEIEFQDGDFRIFPNYTNVP